LACQSPSLSNRAGYYCHAFLAKSFCFCFNSIFKSGNLAGRIFTGHFSSANVCFDCGLTPTILTKLFVEQSANAEGV
jgi:hypothetical protein